MRTMRGRAMGIVTSGILMSALALGAGHVERTGDHLQIALPVAGLVCAVANGEGAGYLARFAGTMAVVHTSKRGLGYHQINLRPSGGRQGFPSGHTAAAAFGASYLAQGCLRRNPVIQGAAIISGAYVGASRIEAGAHFLFQVLAGALTGWIGERSGSLLRAIQRALRRAGRTGRPRFG